MEKAKKELNVSSVFKGLIYFKILTGDYCYHSVNVIKKRKSSMIILYKIRKLDFKLNRYDVTLYYRLTIN